MDRTLSEQQEDRGDITRTNTPDGAPDSEASRNTEKGASGDADGITGGYGTGGVPPQDQSEE